MGDSGFSKSILELSQDAIWQKDITAQTRRQQIEVKESSELQQKNKIKKLQGTIQDLRLTIDDINKEKNRLSKKNNKLKRWGGELQAEIEKLQNKLDELEIQARETQNALKSKDAELKRYEEIFEKAPKIAFFSKSELDAELFPFHKIDQIREIDNKTETIKWGKYREIWLVESDFSYPENLKIKKLGKKVIAARNLKILLEKVRGIR